MDQLRTLRRSGGSRVGRASLDSRADVHHLVVLFFPNGRYNLLPITLSLLHSGLCVCASFKCDALLNDRCDDLSVLCAYAPLFFGEEGLIVEREKKILPHHAKRTTRLAGVASLFVVVVVVSFYFFLLWMTSIATCLSLGVG